jgi:hypothetical protein
MEPNPYDAPKEPRARPQSAVEERLPLFAWALIAMAVIGAAVFVGVFLFATTKCVTASALC